MCLSFLLLPPPPPFSPSHMRTCAHMFCTLCIILSYVTDLRTCLYSPSNGAAMMTTATATIMRTMTTTPTSTSARPPLLLPSAALRLPLQSMPQCYYFMCTWVWWWRSVSISL